MIPVIVIFVNSHCLCRVCCCKYKVPIAKFRAIVKLSMFVNSCFRMQPSITLLGVSLFETLQTISFITTTPSWKSRPLFILLVTSAESRSHFFDLSASQAISDSCFFPVISDDFQVIFLIHIERQLIAIRNRIFLFI